MEGRTTIIEAKEIFGKNFLGPNELDCLFDRFGAGANYDNLVSIHYSREELINAANEGYILVYGVDKLGEMKISIKLFRDTFGYNPEISEPCLYNQDWYLSEDFINKQIEEGWYLIRKDVFESSRAVMPQELLLKDIKFPSAVLCIYTFFAYYFAYGELLWYHDFIWCDDLDHNGDRIYVGKYHDVDGVNKNGFSIHRHLALRPCYGAVTLR